MPAFRPARPAAVQNDQTRFRLAASQLQKVLPIAGDNNGIGAHGVVPDVHVIGAITQNLRHPRYLVTRLMQTAGYFNSDVFINQKSHSSRCAVCAATSGSISF